MTANDSDLKNSSGCVKSQIVKGIIYYGYALQLHLLKSKTWGTFIVIFE